MTLTPQKLRAVVNLLADPLQAAAAANILATEAAQRKLLVADLVAEAMSPERRLRGDRRGPLVQRHARAD